MPIRARSASVQRTPAPDPAGAPLWSLRAKALALTAVIVAAVAGAAIAIRITEPASKSQPAPVVADPGAEAYQQALALVLTLDDFPADWQQSPNAAAQTPIAGICGVDPSLPEPIATAGSAIFSAAAGGAGFTTYVRLFAAPADAVAFFNGIPDRTDCLIQSLKSGDTGTSLFDVAGAIAEPLDLTIDGVRTFAVEIQGTAVIPQLSDQPLTLYDDYVFIQKSDAVGELVIRSIAATDPELRATAARKLALKLK